MTEAREIPGRILYVSEAAVGAVPTMFADVPDVLSKRAVADILGVDERTVSREISRGRLAAFHVGARVRVTKQALVEYVRRSL